MTMAYSDPSRETDPHSLPDVEVFHYSKMEFMCTAWNSVWNNRLHEKMADGLAREAAATELSGWYWWLCFPDCLPDSDPFGPFPTEALALADAQNNGPRVWELGD